jgi:Flp pilus assembly protein TadD
MNPLLSRAELLINQERYDLAVDTLRQALVDAPDDADVHRLLAFCLAEQERFDEATSHAEKAVHLAPDDPQTHYVHSSVLCDRRRWSEARGAIEEALALAPGEPELYAMLARIAYAQERWRDALEAAEQGLAIDGENAGCINLRAMAQVKLGDKAGASATIDQALARRPDDPIAHANQGWVLLEQGNPKKSVEHFREALRLNPEFEWARQGILEALKAHNPIYRLMLAWFLWMARLPGGVRWGIILGGYFGYQFLHSVARKSPDFAPFIWPILIAYVVFAVMTWLVVPLSNLLLRLHPWGRHALSQDAIRGANLVGLSLILPLIAVALDYARGASLGTWWYPYLALLALPASAVYSCERGWPRNVAATVTAALALLGYGQFVGLLAIGSAPVPAFLLEISRLTVRVYIFGIVASQFIMMALARVRPQR